MYTAVKVMDLQQRVLKAQQLRSSAIFDNIIRQLADAELGLDELIEYAKTYTTPNERLMVRRRARITHLKRQANLALGRTVKKERADHLLSLKPKSSEEKE